jgi:hypothetical protein
VTREEQQQSAQQAQEDKTRQIKEHPLGEQGRHDQGSGRLDHKQAVP